MLGYLRSALLLLVYLAAARGTLAGENPLPAAAERTVDFQQDVAPIFERHCWKCHGPEKQESNLRLDQRASLLTGGDRGEPAVVLGDSAASLLIQAVAGASDDLQMPPEGPPLKATEISILRAWIDQGLAGLENEPAEPPPTTDHWSFQPLHTPRVPQSQTAPDWAENPLDSFILQRLEQEQLTPSPEADRRTLLRRLYLDMLGLLPAPEEIDAFAADRGPEAYARAVERVLASPHYGERWARHWLDVVRFAETNGFETNTPRPNAYHYRDYVIRAWNEDKPYDRFVQEQIAGDALGADAATGFLVAGAYDTVKSPDIQLTLMQRQDELADMINVTGGAFLGLTLGCARCHNHKFDPIRQADFYSLQAVFAGVKHGDRPLVTATLRRQDEEAGAVREKLTSIQQQLDSLEASQYQPAPSRIRPAVDARHNSEQFAGIRARFVRFTIQSTNQSEPCIDELEVFATCTSPDQQPRNVALASQGTKTTSSGDYQGNPKHRLEHINDGKYGNSYSWISNQVGTGWVQLEFPEVVAITRIDWSRDRLAEFADRLATEYVIEVAEQPDQWQRVADSSSRRPFGSPRFGLLSAEQQQVADQLLAEAAALEARLKMLTANRTLVYGGLFEQPDVTHRLYRGDPLQPREEVIPDALLVIGSLGLPADAPEQERRLALGKWITSRDNPLTARVMVNRLWHFHFGSGIVATPSDFGANGARPTHPELLDWLAAELIRNDWSLKHIQRLILMSRTYRQSAAWRAEAARVDAEARLLWRYPARRLEAEAIRDNILTVSDSLDVRMFGPGFDVFQPNDNYVRVYTPKEQWGPAEWRRMVYMYKVRMEQDPVFGAFDCPDAGQAAPTRPRSTTAIQALNLFNSPFVQEQSRRMAARLQRECGDDPREQIVRAFRLTYGREPAAAELSAALATANAHGMVTVCRALLNSNEFLFLP